MCNQNVLNIELRYEIIKFCKILTQQNCFQFRDLQHTQEAVPAMGEKTSSVFSEIYPQ